MRVNVKSKAAAAAVAKGAAVAAGQQKKKQQPNKQQSKQHQSRVTAGAVPRKRGGASNGRKTGRGGSDAKPDAATAPAAAAPSVPIYDSDDSYEHHVIDLRDDQYRGANARDDGGLARRDSHNNEELGVENGNGREESGSEMDPTHPNGHVYRSNGKTDKHRKRVKENDNDSTEEGSNGSPLRPSKHTFVPGQLSWAKYARFPWWPALVMDQRGSLEGKGGTPSADTDVLVRFFGTYDYGWVDPFVNLSDFEVKLSERSRLRKKALQKGVEEALEFRSTGKLPDKWDPVYDKSQNGHSNGAIESPEVREVLPTANDEPKERKTPRKRKPKVLFEEEGIVERKPQRTIRRLRVMRQLGLAGPAGSPFTTD